jgi:hypothetical protein
MSFQDPPRRQRQPRYPALARYEDGYASYQDTRADYRGNGYQDGYQEFAGLAGTPQQRPPWDDPQQYGFRGPDAGSQGTPRTSGAMRAVQDAGAQGSIWGTAAQRALRNSGAQQAAWASAAEMTSWDTPVQRTGRGQPSRTPGLFYAAPGDASGQPGRAAGREVSRGRGLLPGAVVGLLAAAVALGVANLVAAFVRPQASPIIAVGEAFIDRTPPALKNFAVQKFGTNDKNMLLLGMYVTIALIAIAIGVLAWRHMPAGVAGIGLFGLFGAFVAITRPESHATDVIPSIVGGIAGITVLIWLISVAVPKTRYRAGRAGGDL